MNSVLIEILKLRRSASWVVVLLLPVAMVLAGGAGTWASGGVPDGGPGWQLVWVRSIGLYGMEVLAVGLAVLASLVWRVEHRGSNWNALMSTPVPTHRLIVAKTAAVSLLAAAMQLVHLAAVVGFGRLALGLSGMLPGRYVLVEMLVVVTCVPVCALQSSMSCLCRSFAPPVAVALVLTGAGTMSLLAHAPGVILLPHALLTRTTQIGAFYDGAPTSFEVQDLTPGVAAATVGISILLTCLVVTVTALVVDRTDTHA